MIRQHDNAAGAALLAPHELPLERSAWPWLVAALGLGVCLVGMGLVIVVGPLLLALPLAIALAGWPAYASLVRLYRGAAWPSAAWRWAKVATCAMAAPGLALVGLDWARNDDGIVTWLAPLLWGVGCILLVLAVAAAGADPDPARRGPRWRVAHATPADT